jgi:hypothetical protein
MSVALTYLKPLELARQFTVMEHALFRAIDPDEIFDTSGDVARGPARDGAEHDCHRRGVREHSEGDEHKEANRAHQAFHQARERAHASVWGDAEEALTAGDSAAAG